MSTWTRAVVIGLVVSAAGCGHASEGPEPAVTPRATGDLVGVWRRDVPGGESLALSLFPSGIAAWQHVGPKLPIALAYGRWSTHGDRLALRFVGIEPEGETLGIATDATFVHAPAAGTLRLEADGGSTTWTLVPDAYGAGAGARERMEHDERSWAGRVERAEPQAP